MPKMLPGILPETFMPTTATTAVAGTSHTAKSFMSNTTSKPTTMKHRQFRVVVKRRNDCVYFINIDNPDDFYVYETAHFSSVRANHIYRESQLHIEGRFVKSILS